VHTSQAKPGDETAKLSLPTLPTALNRDTVAMLPLSQYLKTVFTDCRVVVPLEALLIALWRSALLGRTLRIRARPGTDIISPMMKTFRVPLDG